MRIKKTISIPVSLTILVFLSIIAARIVQFLEWKKDADRFVKAAKIMELLDEASDAAKMCGQFEKFLSSRREFKPSPSVPGDGNEANPFDTVSRDYWNAMNCKPLETLLKLRKSVTFPLHSDEAFNSALDFRSEARCTVSRILAKLIEVSEIWEGYKNGVFHGVPRSDDAELAELKAFFEAQFFMWIRREAGDE